MRSPLLLMPMLLALAGPVAAQQTDAPAESTDGAPAPRLPSSELRAEIDRLRTSNQLLQRKQEELAAEIARVKARIAEIDPDGSLAAEACSERGSGCSLAARHD